jgi:hypothetical protein
MSSEVPLRGSPINPHSGSQRSSSSNSVTDFVADRRRAESASQAATELKNSVLGTRLDHFDPAKARQRYLDQGEFLWIEDFLPASVQQALLDATQASRGELNRNYIPGHKKGGSVSRHTIDRLAPAIANLYRDPALIAWLEAVCGERLQFSPVDDPHAYALYFYTEPGDHIGWHYDTSYYQGRRYTVLLGVLDQSSAKLQYRLHTRPYTQGRAPVDGEIALKPGALVLFNGDQLYHRITPLGADEERIALTFEYVTDPRMTPWSRLISNLKDSFAYFGFRQVFRKSRV